MTKAEVDRALCSGYQRCIDLAPNGFRLDVDRKSVATEATDVDVNVLIDAASGCPVQAITVWGSDGSQLYP